MSDFKTGDEYADAVVNLLNGKPLPDLRRLLAQAYNAGAVAMSMRTRGRSLRERTQTPALRLGGTSQGGPLV